MQKSTINIKPAQDTVYVAEKLYRKFHISGPLFCSPNMGPKEGSSQRVHRTSFGSQKNYSFKGS